LVQGAQLGLLDIDRALADLRATDFRCTPRIFQEAKRRAREEEMEGLDGLIA
jgi:hypothetical protein